jgi:HSP20 family protein
MFEPTLWSIGRYADPFTGLEYLERDIDRLFSGVAAYSDYPAVNVAVGEEDAIITAEIPGLDIGKTDISVAGDIITFSGVREPVDLPEGRSYYIHERTHGEFSRHVRVPFRIDATKVTATYDKGVLSISVPRAEADKPRKISVTSEQ